MGENLTVLSITRKKIYLGVLSLVDCPYQNPLRNRDHRRHATHIHIAPERRRNATGDDLREERPGLGAIIRAVEIADGNAIGRVLQLGHRSRQNHRGHSAHGSKTDISKLREVRRFNPTQPVISRGEDTASERGCWVVIQRRGGNQAPATKPYQVRGVLTHKPIESGSNRPLSMSSVMVSASGA